MIKTIYASWLTDASDEELEEADEIAKEIWGNDDEPEVEDTED